MTGTVNHRLYDGACYVVCGAVGPRQAICWRKHHHHGSHQGVDRRKRFVYAWRDGDKAPSIECAYSKKVENALRGR